MCQAKKLSKESYKNIICIISVYSQGFMVKKIYAKMLYISMENSWVFLTLLFFYFCKQFMNYIL